MARREINKSEIRQKFTKLVDESGKYISPSKWLPSIGGDYENTFTLEGTNPLGGGSSKGEINILTNFNQNDPDDINLLRYTLFLYCTQKDPYFFERSTYYSSYRPNNGLFFEKEIESFSKNYQTGKGESKKQTRSLTADCVRTYKGSKIKDPIDNETSVQSLINYSQIPNGQYEKNVAGVLGKVTYDSVVKHRLYKDLLDSGYISNVERIDAESWVSKATKLGDGQYDLYIDVGGGPFFRAFPVICVFTKDVSGKKISDLIQNFNNLVESKFFRKPNAQDQLVKPLNVGGESNFLESKIRASESSVYCAIYDFAKVITLEPNTKNDYTLGILKIGLSLFSRIQTNPITITEFQKAYKSSSEILKDSYNEKVEELFFNILYGNKHIKETSYLLDKSEASLNAKFSKEFKVEIKKLADSLLANGDKISSIFKEETRNNFQFRNYNSEQELKIILHFDNFYNLLAVTTYNEKPLQEVVKIDEDSPFILEDYKVSFATNELIAKFYNNAETLPTFANGEYKFTPSYALQHDIVLITDYLITQLYKNLEASPDFIYENDKNRDKNDALSTKAFDLLKLINSRLNVNLNKNDYFFISSNKIYLRKEIVRKLNLNELVFSFEGTGENKVKLQTISNLLRNKLPTPDIQKLTIEDLKEFVYYPRLKEVSPAPKPDREIVKPTPPPPKDTPKNNNYLINNIITSELACYEDIANSFDKALNSDGIWNIVKEVAKTLAYIGLPFLLSYASASVAEKLKELSKKADKSLLECVISDRETLKKMIIGSMDIVNIGEKNAFLQLVPVAVQLPIIPYVSVFDLEKELKRRLVEYIIKEGLKYITEKISASLKTVVDMCNADSYLNAFLINAIPDLSSGDKVGTPNSAGLPIVPSSATYVPEILANINLLIDQSGIESRQNVYQLFRDNYFITKNNYSDEEISNFFDFLSSDIDSGEMLVLLKGKSTPEIRGLVLTFIKTYKVIDAIQKDKFSILFDSGEDVASLFIFLAQYIDYRILMEQIANSTKNYTPNICIDVNSKFEDYSFEFGSNQVNAEASELEGILDDICSLKKEQALDIFKAGPTLLTITLSNSLNISFSSIVDSIENSKKQVSISTPTNRASYEITNIPIADVVSKLNENNIDLYIPDNKVTYYKLLTTSEKGSVLSENGGPNDEPEFFAKEKDKFLNSVVTNINDQFKSNKQKYKQIFNEQLKNSGNIGLKTNIEAFSDYIQKYNEMKGILAYDDIYPSESISFLKDNLSLFDFVEKVLFKLLTNPPSTAEEYLSDTGALIFAEQLYESYLQGNFEI